MDDRDEVITIGFSYSDSYGCSHEAKSTVQTFPDIGIDELTVIGEQLNAFLSQCGYIRENTYIFMESITEDEYAALENYLKEYRNNQKGVVNNGN